MAQENVNPGKPVKYLTGIALFLAVLFISAGIILPVLNRTREFKHPPSAVADLKQIGLALMMYALDFEDHFPERPGYNGFNQLITEEYLTDRNVYVLAGSPFSKAENDQLLQEENCSYVYIGSGIQQRVNSSDGDVPIAFSKPELNNKYFNILFADGHVSGFETPELNTTPEVIDYLRQRFKAAK